VRRLVAALEAQNVTPADFAIDAPRASRPSAQATEMFQELMKRLEEDFGRA
jgi:hypothetical protein